MGKYLMAYTGDTMTGRTCSPPPLPCRCPCSCRRTSLEAERKSLTDKVIRLTTQLADADKALDKAKKGEDAARKVR